MVKPSSEQPTLVMLSYRRDASHYHGRSREAVAGTMEHELSVATSSSTCRAAVHCQPRKSSPRPRAAGQVYGRVPARTIAARPLSLLPAPGATCARPMCIGIDGARL